jgi:hypothetical protein
MENSMECAIKKAENRPAHNRRPGDKSLQGHCTFLLQAGRERQVTALNLLPCFQDCIYEYSAEKRDR